jgi:glycosyltransferase involved in cell wall biosynthesis
MKILFVSGTSTGGSARSTEELAARLHARGHQVATLMGWRPRPVRRQIQGGNESNLLSAVALQAGRVDRVVRRQLSWRPRRLDRSPYPAWQSSFPGRCLPAACEQHRPDVVVVTSLDLRTWRSVHAYLLDRGTPSVVYMRAEGTVRDLAAGPLPDLVLSNAHSLAHAATELGVSAVVVPSVVELDRCRVESTRQRVLFVNPIAMRGLHIALSMASARPAIPFVIQETSPLDRRDQARLQAQIGPLANVEVRIPVPDPRGLYRDARVLLAPYLVSNRPRVVLEAQANAIPVLAADVGGLRECVPPGGVLVSPSAPVEEWVRALDELWEDPARYAEFAAAAKHHSDRPEVRPAAIVDRFEGALAALLDGRSQRTSARS